VKAKTRLVSIAIASGCLAAILSALVLPSSSAQGGYQVSSEAVDIELRRMLPLGSSLHDVQAFMTAHGLEHSFDKKSKTMFAIARGVQGSTFLVSKSLAFKLHFDDQFALKLIDTEIVYNAP
jgi:hypothetical protein